MLTVVRGLSELGYCVAWAVLDSKHFGVAQRRERVFIVGSLGDGRCAQVLFEPESVRGDTPPVRGAGEGVAGSLTGGAAGGRTHGKKSGTDREGFLVPEVARAVNAERDGYNDGSDQTYIPQVSKCLNAAPAGHNDGRYQTYVPILEPGGRAGENQDPKAGAGVGEDGDPMFTLQSGKQHAIGFTCKDSGQDATDDGSPTLRSMNFDESHINGGGQVAVAFAERTREGGRSLDVQEDLAYALGDNSSGGQTHSRRIATAMSVRRLTPRECERLQGFPDDWTRHGADDKEVSDSSRYRMLGNAVTVPVARWLGARVAAALKST